MRLPKLKRRKNKEGKFVLLFLTLNFNMERARQGLIQKYSVYLILTIFMNLKEPLSLLKDNELVVFIFFISQIRQIDGRKCKNRLNFGF